MENTNKRFSNLENKTLTELMEINTYLMTRHAYHMKYEQFDKVEVLVDIMQSIDEIILDYFTLGTNLSGSKYSQW